jgi:hypothetical protein
MYEFAVKFYVKICTKFIFCLEKYYLFTILFGPSQPTMIPINRTYTSRFVLCRHHASILSFEISTTYTLEVVLEKESDQAAN